MRDIDDEQLIRYHIDRQAAIDSNRAIAEKALNRYDQVENGWDPDNLVEITDTRTMERIQDEIAVNLAEKDIYLIYTIGHEGTWDADTMARTDGNASNDRLVCVPAAYWSSRTYGPIVLIRANTIEA